MGRRRKGKEVLSLRHGEEKRRNIPTAEFQPMVSEEISRPLMAEFERRNRDLDPQLVWRGKDFLDWSELVVAAPALYIQEKVQPKVLIDDLLRESRERAAAQRAEEEAEAEGPVQLDLFADFNGIPEGATGTDFYQHEANWSNRIILGDSLQVMASLAEREGLRGKVQCIYIDPPYGIKFNSNFQWSTTSRDVKDGNSGHITREPEQVKAFRDTWRDGIHSYLTYLRDRLTVARDLLTEGGSIFVQIGEENAHRVRGLMDEVFGSDNFIGQIPFRTTTSTGSQLIESVCDYLIWYARNRLHTKYRQLFFAKSFSGEGGTAYNKVELRDGSRRSLSKNEKSDTSVLPSGFRIYRDDNLTSQRPAQGADLREFVFQGEVYTPGKGTFKTDRMGLVHLTRSHRLEASSQGKLYYVRFFDDFPVFPMTNQWNDTSVAGFTADKLYVVQSNAKVIQRCVLMTTDPGDLVLDPTCGSGTTAYVAEQWGRRWITIDTSRVALALARARLMGARYPYYLLADSKAGQAKEGEARRAAPSSAPTYGDIRHGFVYQRVPHIMLKHIANNAEIDVIWEAYQERLEPLRERLNAALGERWEEWEIPREPVTSWPSEARAAHREWWEMRIARQKEIDASIAANAEQEYLYDQPYEDKNIARVAGPFTVESLSPHRILAVDEAEELQPLTGKVFREKAGGSYGDGAGREFAEVILENLRSAGVQQAHKEDRIRFTSLVGWPGRYICAEGRYLESAPGTATERRAGVFVGPEFGTVSRPDLVAAAREAADAGFDVLIACAFNYDAHSTEFERLGRIPVLKARMNADLHMAGELKNTGQGNLFVIFGEPDIEIRELAPRSEAEEGMIEVEIRGVDVFHPQSGEVRSSGPEGIACWFIDTDYNEESFFVRQAYFLGMNDPYGALKSTLKAEIDREAWESLHSAVSRPFARPGSGRIAVKVINHLGDEVMKVFSA